jgi:phytoene dehydrogenase-like protein
MRNSVIVIGAGVAGLSAACHLAASGYDTRVVEAASLPGGLCTSWRRGDYLFDGCIHWLPGVTPASPLFAVNDEVIGLADVRFVHHDPVVSVETVHSASPDGDKMFHLWADIDHLDEYLHHVAPDDDDVIDTIIGICRDLTRYDLPPVMDPPEVMGLGQRLGMARHLPLMVKLRRWAKLSMSELAGRARSPFLREALSNLTFGNDYPIIVLLMQVAFADQGTSGTPLGGSLSIARRIEERYMGLGGQIRYRAPVDRILEREGRACGVRLADGSVLEADIVISACDGHFTLFDALEGRHVTPALEELYALERLEPFESLVYVSLGLNASYGGQPVNRFFFFPEERRLCDGSMHRHIQAHLVDYDPAQAPEGKSVINVMLPSREFDFWTGLRATDRERYVAAKREALDFVLDALDEKIGGVSSALETWDVATPATFHRYTANWMGSYEGWYPSKDFLAAKPLPRTLPTLRDFYMIGQWVEPGGGITPSIKTGRDIARIICKEDGRRWQVPSPTSVAVPG